MTARASDLISTTASTIKGLAKLLLQSSRATITRCRPQGSRIIILGNGPSLNQTIAQSIGVLRSTPAMAVNFAANAPVFTTIRPAYYILVDPLFFSGKDLPNLISLWQRLAAVDWDMTLIVPVGRERAVPDSVRDNVSVNIATVNALGIEGARWLTDAAYRSGRGMPRPRNVLIAAIMAAVQMGYREIYITGADHSWMSTISVNERNEVISVQPHFYKDDEGEVTRVNTEYLRHPLHQVVHSFYVAFKSYHDIAAYARRHGIAIYNSTPGSFIDAFERRPLPEGK